jgi:hypothetical protein
MSGAGAAIGTGTTTVGAGTVTAEASEAHAAATRSRLGLRSKAMVGCGVVGQVVRGILGAKEHRALPGEVEARGSIEKNVQVVK